jgi:hypothetical protein
MIPDLRSDAMNIEATHADADEIETTCHGDMSKIG